MRTRRLRGHRPLVVAGFVYFLAAAALVVGTEMPVARQGPDRKPPVTRSAAVSRFVIRPSDFVMSEEEASKFSVEVIEPILNSCSKDEAEIGALRKRISGLIRLLNGGGLYYVPMPAPYPDRAITIVAKTETYGDKTVIFVFAPTAMEFHRKLSAADFKYFMLVTFAHEMIHLEQRSEFSTETRRDAAKEEAVAWGKTIVQLVRPLLEARKTSLPYYMELSQRFMRFRDNNTDPNWIKLWLN